MRRPFTLWERLKRLVHYRLIVPLKRSQHPPEYTARGVMIGVFWAFTPLIGVQLYLVALTWAICRWNHRFDFNLIIAFAWVWVTNVFTMLPIYYFFYITGRFLMGDLTGATGYDQFVAAWQAALDADGFVDKMLAWAHVVATEQGVPMFIGCTPYAFGFAWLGYRWSLKYVHQRRRARAARIARKRRKRLAKAAEKAARAARAARPALDGGTPGPPR